jgi:hypothetical protein
MKLETLTIGLRSPYNTPSPSNPYEAKLSVSYNDNKMTVKLLPETCERILALAGDEIASAAQVQISDFVQAALTVSKIPMIEATATSVEESF